jgi:TonB-linked SusC/RagA family outer membrane protein
MKITAIILLSACLTASARGFSQKVTLSEKNAPLSKIFKAIKSQTGYTFLYTDEMLAKTGPVTINLRDVDLTEALNTCFNNQPLTYSIINKTIVVKVKESTGYRKEEPVAVPLIDVKGRVVNETGEGVVTTVVVKGTNNGTSSNSDGYFELKDVDPNATLMISAVNIAPLEVKINGRTTINITVKLAAVEGEEVTINAGYYKTTAKTKVGNISKVNGKDIERQPVTSLLTSLQGRMAGVDITPNNGAAGTGIRIQIRGTNSIRFDGGYPLYIIDGVPIDSRPVASISTSQYANGGFDPLSTMDPSQIESIEVLKDADATAIYGSRGANGVVLITTKKGNVKGKTIVAVNYYHGISSITNRVDMLDRRQYLDMRYEAYVNDGINIANLTLGATNYDLLAWDTTRSTDWQEVLLGGNAYMNDVQVSLSGGAGNTSFNASLGYHKEGVVFPGDFGFRRMNGQINFSHRSNDQKLSFIFSANYGQTRSQLYNGLNLVTYALTLPPVAPKIYDDNGNLNWQIVAAPGLRNSWTNPFSVLNNLHDTRVGNLLSNAQVSYRVARGLTLSTNLGFSKLTSDDNVKTPSTTASPTSSTNVRRATFINTSRDSWIIEPQINFSRTFKGHHIHALAGTTFQSALSANQSVTGSQYASDALLNSIDGAQTKTYSSGRSEYRYTAVFMRIGYDWKNKYLVNLTGRRDGSSRFGPGRQFGNFGAIGAGWVFSNEKIIQDKLAFISFGKIRASYGITGNDQIGDYNYLDRYSITSSSYQGLNLIPSALLNPDYRWEETRKAELGVELGLFKDRIAIEISRYWNRSSNQLVQYALPYTTGFPAVLANFDAVIDNTGWEFVIRTENIKAKNFHWTSAFNFSIPKNTLAKYDDIESSSYASLYVVGQPLSILQLYTWKGVNPQTGLHEVVDLNNDGIINNEDRSFMKPTGRRYYGGIINTIRSKGIELSFLLQLSKSMEFGFLSSNLPGTHLGNQPTSVLKRWRKNGDVTTVGRFSQTTSNANTYSSQAWYTDLNAKEVFFTRLKTLSVSYSIPKEVFGKKMPYDIQLFLQGQNLFTITDYREVLDPETKNELPPLRIYTLGIQIKF